MAKVTLLTLANLGGQPTSAQAALNANFDAIAAAMEKTLTLDGTSPNEMRDVLDMNGFDIINLPAPGTDNSPVRLQDLNDALVGGSDSYGMASEAEAIAGVSNVKVMSPLRVSQAIDDRLQSTSVSDAQAADMVTPTPFTTSTPFPHRYDIKPVEVSAPGIVRMSKNVGQYMETVSISGPTSHSYVSNSGNDGDTGAADDHAFLTLDHAIRTDVAVNVHVWPGYYDIFQFRTDLDAAATIKKRIINRLPGQGRSVYIGVYTDAPVLSSATWTKTGGFTNIYETTLTLSGSMVPHRVVYQDRWDNWGFYDRLTNYSSLANLDAAGGGIGGWYFDSGTSKLYLTFFGLNVETHKAKFKGYFTDTSGNSRIYLFGGVNIAFIGYPGDFIFDGVSVKTLNATGSATAPNVGLQNVTIQYPDDHGVAVQGGVVYSSGVRVHAPLNDCFNYNPNFDGPATPAFAIEHNCFATMAGDVTSFPSAAENKNGSSAHGGADIIRAGGFYADNLGPNIVDTTEVGYNSYSWVVGARTQKSAAVSNYGGLQFADTTTGTRTVWVDTCATLGEVLSLDTVGDGITLKYTNCQFNVSPTNNGSTVSTYLRNAP